MADPFSITSSAAGVISLGLTVSKGLLEYYESYKSGGATVTAMYTQLKALASTLALLNKVIDRGYVHLDPELARNAEDSIEGCRAGLSQLDKKLAKVRKASQQESTGNLREQLGKHIQRATFPFKESTLVKLREVALELRNDLTLVLEVLQIDVSAVSLQRLDGIDAKLEVIAGESVAASANVLNFGQDLEAIGDILVGSQLDEERRLVHDWLRPPDPFANHDAARQKHTQSTNEWFLQGHDFATWLKGPKALLMVYGIPGSGKTIIASSVIAEIEDTLLDSKSILLYYYFDFDDRQKQTISGCVSSLLLQLAMVTDSFEKLWHLYQACNHGQRQPSAREMTEALQTTIGTVPRVYLILDALDECSELDMLLEFMIEIYESWDLDLKVLATCRKERNIDEALETLNPITVNLHGELITQDINVYVEKRLNTNARLKKWCLDAQIKSELKQTLVEKADGMFRWVVCQLDALQRCLTAASLKKTLRALPKTLYDTYDRILLSIDSAYHQQAIHVLRWLAVARRPLYTEEAAEIVTTLPADEDETPIYDADNRLSDPNDVFQICLSLVSTSVTAEAKSQNGQLVPAEFLRLAHFSVKEYLTSQAIRQGPYSAFHVNEFEAHMSVAQACIAYLLNVNGPVNNMTSLELPLADYAANFWNVHAELGFHAENGSILEEKVIELLESVHAMTNIHTLCKPHYPTHSLVEKPALHWAAQFGLLNVVERIMMNMEDINKRDRVRRTALHIAIQFRQEAIARFLIRQGIDIDAQDFIGTALHYAIQTEDVGIVQILLDGKADPNLRIALRNNPLYSAAQRNHLKMVELLLGHGADPNAPCKLNKTGGIMFEERSGYDRPRPPAEPYHMGTALQVAAWRGFSAVVNVLLDAGAVVDNAELLLLSQGKIQEALRAMERIGEYPYHFQNELPNYADTVAVFQTHMNRKQK